MQIDYEEKKQAHKRALDTFIEVSLYPAIASRLADVFPEYHFTQRAGTWHSTYNIEGNDTGKKEAVLFCRLVPGQALAIGGNGSKSGIAGSGRNVLGLYAERHRLGGREEAAEAIADLLGVPGFPKWEGYRRGDSSEAELTIAHKEAAAAAFTDSLVNGTTAGAAEARKYLHSRFTEAEYEKAIKAHLIGYADPEVLRTLERTAPKWHRGTLQSNIGTIHTIAVVTSYGMIKADSFNFRALPSQEAAAAEIGKAKYDMPAGTYRDVLGGLPYGCKSVYVVEGEIDRLKATLSVEVANEARRNANKPLIKDVYVVSAGTNRVSDKKALEAIKRGVEYFTLIPDMDAPKEVVDTTTGEARKQFTHELPGEDGIRSSIATLYGSGAKEVYVAPLPTETNAAGEVVKIDTADYITRYGVEAWYKAVNASKKAALPFKAERLLRKHVEEVVYYGVNEEAKDKLFTDLEALIFDRHADYNTAEQIYGEIAAYLAHPGNAEYFRFSLDQFRKYVDGKKQREEAVLREAALKADLAEAYKRSEAGDMIGARSLITESIEKNTPTAAADYAKLYSVPGSVEEIESSFTEVVPGVPTGIHVHTVEGKRREITIKEGVSLLVGARKHGKTTFLCNIALNEAERNVKAHEDDITAPLKKVLLFTYEVQKNRLLRNLLTIYLRKTYPHVEGLNNEAIAAFYEDKVKLTGEAGRVFASGKATFFRDYIQSGAITVVDMVGRKDVEDLTGSLSQYLSSPAAEGGVSLVALDYIQKLSTRQKDKKANRPAELKHIGEVLTDFGVRNKLPILCAAQFNRISNLLQVDTTNIGEAGDLERNAVDVIGIFNLKELMPLQGSDYTLGFGLHKSVLYKFGLNKEDFIEDVPTGEYYKDEKSGHRIGEEKTRENLKPLSGKVYVKLLASRFGSFPADVLVDFYGESGYVDIDKTIYTVEDCIKREKFIAEAKAVAAFNGTCSNQPGAAPGGTEEGEEDEHPIF